MTGTLQQCSLGVATGLCLVGLAPLCLRGSDTVDPNNDGSQYAWTENVGWLNAEPLGDGGPGMRVLATRVEGWLWLENAGWVSLSCHTTDSCSSVDFDVTHDGFGALAGFGWSENLGWISFSCENTGSCAAVDYGVTIDPVTGEFSGFAWAENFGWISFSCENTGSCASVDYRVVTEIPFIGELPFSDGFDSGDTSRWSATVP